MNAASFIGRLLLSSAFLWSSAATADAQSVSRICKQVELAVVKNLNPQSIDNRIGFRNGCWVDFTVKDQVDVDLSIQKYKTEQEGQRSLEAYLSLVAFKSGLDSEKQLHLEKLETKNNWDEVYFCKAGVMNSGFLLLRKGRVTVRIVSRKDEILIDIESKLGDVSRYRWR